MPTTRFTKELYFVTTTVIDWLDVFTRPAYKHIVLESLRYCQQHKSLDIYAWVLMTNHLHVIVGLREGGVTGDVMRDFKIKFWQDGSYIERIDSCEFYRQKVDYVHMNPVRQEIVERPEEYLYSSARDYAGEKGLLDVVVLP